MVASSSPPPELEPEPELSWVILGRITRVEEQIDLSVELVPRPEVSEVSVPVRLCRKRNHDGTCVAAAEDEADLSVALSPQPRMCTLAKPQDDEDADEDARDEDDQELVAEDVDSYDKLSYVVATDDAGLLLHVVDRPFVGLDLERTSLGRLVLARDFVPANAAVQLASRVVNGSAILIPASCRSFSDVRNIGIISLPGSGGAEFIIAELRLGDGAENGVDRATLLSFRSGKDAWVERDLPFSARLQGRPKAAWSSDDVISHNGRLWWVDLGWGLLGCDPFTDEPLALRRMQLPFTFDVDPNPNIQCNRIVGVSKGRLRYVDIVRDPIDPDEDTLVVIKFLNVGPEDEERWEYQISKTLDNIWRSPSYEATGMPKEVPELALLDPMNGNVIYFFLKEYLFSVDLEEVCVVNFINEADQPLRWRSIISWELPHHLTNELTATTWSRGPTALGLQARFCCAICNSEAGSNICELCAQRVKRKLSVTNASKLMVPSIGYCLQCHKFVVGSHTIHEKMKVPIHSYKGEPMAWVTGNESWSSLFNEIESDSGIRPTLGRPFRLYRPKRNNCRVCNDLLPEDELYAPSHKFCTVRCWLEGDGAEDYYGWDAARGLLAVDFDTDLDTFCIPCAREVNPELGHQRHDCLTLITDSGCRPRVQLDAKHPLAYAWRNIQGSAGGVEDRLDILVKDDISVRCCKCGIRLADTICKYCSWECSLQRQLLPRILQ